MNSWIEISVELDPRYLEEVSGFLYRLGCSGIHEQDDAFKVYFDKNGWNSDKLLLIADFLKRINPAFSMYNLHYSDVENQDWTEKWKENFKPLRISGELIVLPEWETWPPKENERTLIINPKMAFGTGHHETSKLILRLLPKYLISGQAVLDAGTGSGILAIYAAMLGAARVVAFDNDPIAVENARENFALNDVQDKIVVFEGELAQVKDENFPLILANINRNVLLQLAQDFYSCATKQGLLILSGLLQEDFELINETYTKKGWRLIDQKQDGEWLALIFEKSNISV